MKHNFLTKTKADQNPDPNLIDYYHRVIGSDPGNIQALLALAGSAYAIGDHVAAALCYEEALGLVPQNSPQYYGICISLGKVYMQQGYFVNAIEQFMQPVQNFVMQPVQHLELLFDLARCYEALGQLENAIMCYTEIVQLDPNNIDAYLNIAESHQNLAQYQAAIEAYDKALGLGPNDNTTNESIYLELLSLYKMNQQPDKVLSAFEKLQELGSDGISNTNYLIVGEIYKDLGKLQEAAGAFRKAFEIDPKSASYSLINVLNNLSDYTGVVSVCEEALKHQPEDFYILYKLGTASFALGKPQEARVALDGALKFCDEEVCRKSISAVLANVEIALGDSADAEEIFKKNNDYYQLGRLYSEAKRYEKAIEAFQKGLEIDPESTASQCGLGHALYEYGQFKEAHLHLAIAFQKNPKDWYSLEHAAQSLCKSGNPEQALQTLYDANISFDAYSVWANVAQTLREVGSYADAIQAYIEAAKSAEAVKNGIEATFGYYSAASIAVHHLHSPEKAFSLNQKALECAPDESLRAMVGETMKYIKQELNGVEQFEEFKQVEEPSIQELGLNQSLQENDANV